MKLLLIAFFLVFSASLASAEEAGSVRVYRASFLSCYDGDTCDFNINLGLKVVLAEVRVRFCDINAPEIRPLKTRAAATLVRDEVVKMLIEAKSVLLKVPQKKRCSLDSDISCDKHGKYGRLLAYVVADGVNINQHLLDEEKVNLYMSCQ